MTDSIRDSNILFTRAVHALEEKHKQAGTYLQLAFWVEYNALILPQLKLN